MLPPQSDSSSPSVPTLPPKDPSVHILEARLVEEEPEIPIYDAVEVQVDGPRPWYKKHQRSILVGMVLSTGAVAATLGTLLVSQNNNNAVDEGNESTTTVFVDSLPSSTALLL